MRACVRACGFMCVALLMSLQRRALVCFVVVPISEVHAQATDLLVERVSELLPSAPFGGGCW